MGKQFIATVNGGSSSIKFSICDASHWHDGSPVKVFKGSIDRLADGDQGEALVDQIAEHLDGEQPTGIGHRVVLGGLKLTDHQLITDNVLVELKNAQPMDLTHLPREIALIETFQKRYPGVPQVACFDTAFHRDLPRTASLLPIPRRYDRVGIRKLGFHGLSYTYLMQKLKEIGAEQGRVVLAHLGSGSSMAAVKDGQPIDTTMCFTPVSGIMMGTRPGDLDPGLLTYLMQTEGLDPSQMDDMLDHSCGLLGVSETSADIRDLLETEATDARAREALALFCYQAKKSIGALAAAMGGLDTLVFAGGIGEHSPEIRSRICDGLEFLGLTVHPKRNQEAPEVISWTGGHVSVRVIPTDEEAVIAQTVCRLLDPVAYESKESDHENAPRT